MIRRSIQKISAALCKGLSREKSLSQLGLLCTILDGCFIDLPPQIHSLPQDGQLAVTQRSICVDLVVVLHRPTACSMCTCQKQQCSSEPHSLFTYKVLHWLFFNYVLAVLLNLEELPTAQSIDEQRRGFLLFYEQKVGFSTEFESLFKLNKEVISAFTTSSSLLMEHPAGETALLSQWWCMRFCYTSTSLSACDWPFKHI